jgi:hypothetical protein
MFIYRVRTDDLFNFHELSQAAFVLAAKYHEFYHDQKSPVQEAVFKELGAVYMM